MARWQQNVDLLSEIDVGDEGFRAVGALHKKVTQDRGTRVAFEVYKLVVFRKKVAEFHLAMTATVPDHFAIHQGVMGLIAIVKPLAIFRLFLVFPCNQMNVVFFELLYSLVNLRDE
jgi:hypothetical protein